MTHIQGVHPYANKFPMLPDSELEELAESIRENGQRQPIVLTTDGLILDGRNRYKACEMINVEPEVTVYEGDDLAAYVIDCNVSRRHLTTGQRAMCDALVLDADGARQDGKWNYGAGRNLQIVKSRLSQAGVIIDYKPDLAEKVVSGQVAFNDAYQQADSIRQSAERDKIMERERKKREREQAKADAERDANIVADLTQADATYYLEQIEQGHMKPVSAWAAYQAENQRELDRQAAERRNDEQQVRAIGDILEHLTFLESEEQRDWYLRATAKYPDAMIERQQALHNPQRIRELANALSTYATELEAHNVA